MASPPDTAPSTSPEGPAPDAGAVTDEAQPVADPTATGHEHPSELDYVKVALFLAAITGAEVAVYYVKSLKGVLVPILLLMSAVKFGTVVLWFMHLRFDSRIFRRLFVAGLMLALFVYLVVLTTFHFWSR
jgi:cytochrome c oxidase subunit 4